MGDTNPGISVFEMNTMDVHSIRNFQNSCFFFAIQIREYFNIYAHFHL